MRSEPPVPALRSAKRSVRSASLAAGLLIGASIATSTALAQMTDLRKLAVDWARGRYNSPLVCEIDGELIRGLRRLLVAPAPPQSTIPMGRLIFVEMDTEHATRCFTDLGETVVNLKGTLKIRFPGPPRSDRARRELKTILKREQGLTFDVVEGTLFETPVGKPGATPRPIDFAGGTAIFEKTRAASDAQRLLSDYQSPRKLLLRVRPKDGKEIALPVFLVDFR